MQASEFWELLYYHIIYSLDTGFISLLLLIATIELVKIRLQMEELTGEKVKKEKKNKTNKCYSDPENEH